MERKIKQTFLITASFILIVSILTGCQTSIQSDIPASSVFRVEEKDEGLVVMDGNKNILFYRTKPASFSDKVWAMKDTQTNRTLKELLSTFDDNARPHYIHPLYGLDGEVLTEDFPLDHPHQHGIFWAWHQLLIGEERIANGWKMKDVSWHVSNVKVSEQSTQSAVLKSEVLWKSPNFTDSTGSIRPFIKETAIIRIHRVANNMRKIDFQINLLALADGVRIGGANNKKGYGGFSARLRIPEKGLAFTSQNGAIKPKNTPIEAGPWIDFSGHFPGSDKVSGLTVLCHKSNPGSPTPWILRRRESMQNVVYPGRYPIELSRKESLVLRYRLIIHRGDAQQLDLDKLQAQYNAE
jgi:hypothetical protein